MTTAEIFRWLAARGLIPLVTVLIAATAWAVVEIVRRRRRG